MTKDKMVKVRLISSVEYYRAVIAVRKNAAENYDSFHLDENEFMTLQEAKEAVHACRKAFEFVGYTTGAAKIYRMNSADKIADVFYQDEAYGLFYKEQEIIPE